MTQQWLLIILGALGAIVLMCALLLVGVFLLIERLFAGVLHGFTTLAEGMMRAIDGVLAALGIQLAPPAPEPKPSTGGTPTPSSGLSAGPPPWWDLAIHEIGNTDGSRYLVAAKTGGTPGENWCADFAGAMLEDAGVPGTHSAAARSYASSKAFAQLSGPALGAIVVFWRVSKTSGLGHVGFYAGERGNQIWVLGGNEGGMVQIEAIAKQSNSMGFIDYYWPASVALPKIGAITLPASVPAHETTASKAQADWAKLQIGQAGPQVGQVTPTTASRMTGITATVFGGPGDTQQSAYGVSVDPAKPGVALPYHFQGVRQRVRVYANNKSIDCDIVDVGPWNTNDPYWQNGARPQSETGTDMHGRTTNHAGIDLTPAAAAAIGIDGKGVADWEFIT